MRRPESSTARWRPRGISGSASTSSGVLIACAPSSRATTSGTLDVRVVDAPDVVEMAESPAQALRRKPRASIRVAAELVARGDAAALVSAGHTGAAVVAAHAAFGMLPGVDRPALAPSVPDARRVGGPDRRRRDGGMQAELSAAVRRDGVGLRAHVDGDRAAARRVAVDWRGRDQGQRADARSASVAQGARGCTLSATSKRATSSRVRPT